MTKEEIKNKVVDFLGDMSHDIFFETNEIQMFSYLFKDICHRYRFTGNDIEGFRLSKCFDDSDDSKLSIKAERTYFDANKIIKTIADKLDALMFYYGDNFIYLATDRIVIKIISNGEDSILKILVATDEDKVDYVKKIIEDSISYKEKNNEKNTYKVAYRGSYSINTTKFAFNNWDCDISKNYKDDLPYKEINDIIRKNTAGLIMFYGEPGTGKTSLIKSIINDNSDIDFIFIDSTLCNSISDGQFLEFLNENRNSVVVFEDCEKLLESRDKGLNHSIGTILNLTDGIMAESMKIKFICTFNCELSKIDKAILRKGRLSLMYEFSKLPLEKVKNIYKDAKEDMTLADAYNAENKVIYSEKNAKKLGF